MRRRKFNSPDRCQSLSLRIERDIRRFIPIRHGSSRTRRGYDALHGLDREKDRSHGCIIFNPKAWKGMPEKNNVTGILDKFRAVNSSMDDEKYLNVIRVPFKWSHDCSPISVRRASPCFPSPGNRGSRPVPCLRLYVSVSPHTRAAFSSVRAHTYIPARTQGNSIDCPLGNQRMDLYYLLANPDSCTLDDMFH